MAGFALPRWLDWAWQLDTWFPLSPSSRRQLGIEGAELPSSETACPFDPACIDNDHSWKFYRRGEPLSLSIMLDRLDPDFSRYIREPGAGDVWLEERIKEHLAPILRPLEPVQCPPPYVEDPDFEDDPAWCQARQLVFR